jgi:hypothetical protein
MKIVLLFSLFFTTFLNTGENKVRRIDLSVYPTDILNVYTLIKENGPVSFAQDEFLESIEKICAGTPLTDEEIRKFEDRVDIFCNGSYDRTTERLVFVSTDPYSHGKRGVPIKFFQYPPLVTPIVLPRNTYLFLLSELYKER